MRLLMGAIFFGNPALWIGLTAMGVPLLIHLLTRRTPRKLIFPTLQFLRAAMAQQSSFYRLRHVLLLTARSLLLLLLVLAFVKPILSQHTARGGNPDQAARIQIICLDTSLSMGVVSGGVNPFARAKAAAMKILANHRPGDRANLICMDTTPQGSFEEPSDSIYFLRKDLQETTLSQERANVNAALAEAVRQLSHIHKGRKQIFLVSDFQRSNWSAVDYRAVPKDIELFFIPTGLKDTGNGAVTEVRVHPVCPTVAEEVEVLCRVSNSSDQGRTIPVKLRFHEGKEFAKQVFLEPHTTTSVSFRMRFNTARQYEGEVFLPEDGLVLDDRRFFTLNVSDKVNVLLVSDTRNPSESTGTRFLANAINPYLQQQHATAVATMIRSKQINTVNTSRAQVVILTEIAELTTANAGILLDYLRKGGSVVYFHVGAAAGPNLRLLAQVSEGDFICPYRLRSQVDWQGQDQAAMLSQANFDHAILKKFKDAGQLADIRFYRYFGTERQGQQGQILLRYDDGAVAMAQATVGAGILHLCNFGCDLHHSDIAKHTLFVPMVHEMIRGLRPHTGTRNAFVVGGQCYMTVASITPATELTFKDPDERILEGSVDHGAQGAAVFFPNTDRCGFYTVWADGQVAGSMAVNPDPLESKLEILEVTQVEELARNTHASSFTVAGHPGGLEQALSGKSLWHYFLFAALVMLCLEQGLALLCKH